MNKPKHTPSKVAYIDVDGTLLINGKPNTELITRLTTMKAAGFSLMLWSARGKGHAEKAAVITRTVGLFDAILPKPGYVVDDMGSGWAKFIRVMI